MPGNSTALDRRSTRPTPEPPALVSAQLSRLETQLGGRDVLIAALSHAPKSRDLSYLLGLIGDPRHTRIPLAKICAMGGITAGELIEAYKSGELNRAQALAIGKVGAKLPEVAEDTMRLALTHTSLCTVCYGHGDLPGIPTAEDPTPTRESCEVCQGSGEVLVGGDLEHKKLALEMGRMLQKGGGVNLQVNQQVGVQLGGAGGALEKLQAVTDQILYGEGGGVPVEEAAILDAEVEVEVEEADTQSSPEIDSDTPIEEGDWREDGM